MVNKYTLSVVTILTSISLYSCTANVTNHEGGPASWDDFSINIKDEHFSFNLKSRINLPSTPITSIKDLGNITWTQTVQAEANYKFLQGSVFFERTGYVVKDVITGLAAVAKIALPETAAALIPCKDTGLYTFNAKVAVPVNGNTYVGQVSSSPNKQAIGYVSSANQFTFSVEKTDKNGNVTKLADFDLLQPTTTDKLGVFDVY